jgi:hypothetical protein
MTKTEFKAQFKRLRTAGYRLPVWDGITVDDVLAEWFDTFGSCSLAEFSAAIDKLKQVKTDTFWPATGEIWTHVFEYRKERRIRLQVESGMHYTGVDLTPEQRQEMASMFREFTKGLSQRMAMPKAEPQTVPQEITDAEEIAREDHEGTA